MPLFNRRRLDNLNPLSDLAAEPIRLWDGGRGRQQVAALLQTRLGVGQGIGENPNVLLDTGQTNSELWTSWKAAMMRPGSVQIVDGKGQVKILANQV